MGLFLICRGHVGFIFNQVSINLVASNCLTCCSHLVIPGYVSLTQSRQDVLIIQAHEDVYQAPFCGTRMVLRTSQSMLMTVRVVVYRGTSSKVPST